MGSGYTRLTTVLACVVLCTLTACGDSKPAGQPDTASSKQAYVHINYEGDAQTLPSSARVFVFVRKVGERMPVAVEQLSPRQLPTQFVFSHAETDDIEAVARLSLTGKVNRSAGDAEVHQRVTDTGMVNLTIPEGHTITAFSGKGLSVTLSLDDDLHASPQASVYVIARKAGEPIPIAVKRRSPANIGSPVVLTDADSMMSMNKLTMYDEVEVIARLSQRGDPIRRAGDWESAAVTMEMGDTKALRIDTPVR